MDAKIEVAANHTDVYASARRPFVGLRSFGSRDSGFYFGRTEQIDRLQQMLLTSQLISVIGSSGSGKSSLVRAGLLPRLHDNPLFAGQDWTWVSMRPGDAPVRNLADALARRNDSPDLLHDYDLLRGRADRIELLLFESSFGIRDALNLDAPPPDETGAQAWQQGAAPRPLVILVDQFEEIFRFADLREQRGLDPRQAAAHRDEATLFVQLLLAAVEDLDCPCRVILTMRSDFIGECARFHGLSEAVTASQYLVPALTRDQRSESIRFPVERAGGSIDSTLVQRLLNETNEDMDQLPVLQHVMMRCWQHAARRDSEAPHLTLDDYNAVGGIANALTNHANEVLDELTRMASPSAADPNLDDVARRVFQCLTDTDSQGRTTRRPQTLGALAAVLVPDGADAGASAAAEQAVRVVVAHFSNPDCSFLRAPAEETMDAGSVIDIGHEALIRRWERLGGAESTSWVREEQRDAERYRNLVSLANLGLMDESQLSIYETWWQERRPNRNWARRYARGDEEGIAAAHGLLLRSRTVIAKRRHAERRRRRMWWIAAIVSPIVAFAVVAGYLTEQKRSAQRDLAEARRTQGELTSMIGMGALRLIDPHTALLIALQGMVHPGSPVAADSLDAGNASDVPPLSRLAYAALEQLRERLIIRVSNSFMGLGFDDQGDMLTYTDTLHVLGHAYHQYLTAPVVAKADAAVPWQAAAIPNMPYASDIEVSADGGTTLLANSAQTFVAGKDGAAPYELQVSAPRSPDVTAGAPSPRGTVGDSDDDLTVEQDSVGVGTMSRDGSLILTARRDGIARVWHRNQASGKFEAAGDLPMSQTCLPSASRTAARAAPGASASRFRPVRQGTAVAISGDGKFLAIGTISGKIYIFQSAGGPDGFACVRSLSLPPPGLPSQVWMVTFDPTDAGLLAASYQGGAPYLWQDSAWADKEAKPIRLNGGQSAFRVGFSQDGGLFAAPSINPRGIDVWEVRTAVNADPPSAKGIPPLIHIRTAENFFQIAFDTNRWLAGGSQNGNIWIWDLQGGALSSAPATAVNSTPVSGPAVTEAAWDGDQRAFSITVHNPQVRTARLDLPSNWPDQTPSVRFSADGLWALVTPQKGVPGFIVLYDLRRNDSDAIATFGDTDDTWGEPATFVPAPGTGANSELPVASVTATTASGRRMTWRYFPANRAMTDFSCQHLPVTMDLVANNQPTVRKATLPADIQYELAKNFWPALTSLMSRDAEYSGANADAAAGQSPVDPVSAKRGAICP